MNRTCSQRVRRRLQARPWPAVVVALLLIVHGTASRAERAQLPGAAELLQANEMIREGRCEAAIPLLRRAHEVGNLRNALWNLAECYSLMRRPRPAIDAYRMYMDHARTTAQDRITAQAAIERLEASLARIEIASSVEGARIRVNGLDEGSTPSTVEVGPGTCVVEVTSPGFRPWTEELELGAGEQRSLRADLELAPGELQITSSPPGAAVAIDGRPREGVTPWLDDDMTGGGHLVELRLDGRRTTRRQVLVTPGARTTLDVDLHPLEGSLVVASNATSARLLVDGEERARSPFPPLDLDPGHYRVAVEAEDHGDWSGEVDVLDQRTTRVELELPSTEGVHKAWFWSVTGITLASLAATIIMGGVVLFEQSELDTHVAHMYDEDIDALSLAVQRDEGNEIFDRLFTHSWTGIGLTLTTAVGCLAMFFLGIFTRFRDPPVRSDVSVEDAAETEGVSIDSPTASDQGGAP